MDFWRTDQDLPFVLSLLLIRTAITNVTGLAVSSPSSYYYSCCSSNCGCFMLLRVFAVPVIVHIAVGTVVLSGLLSFLLCAPHKAS